MNMYRYVCAWNSIFSCDPLSGDWCRIQQTKLKSKLILPLNFLCYTYRKCVPLDFLWMTTPNPKMKSKVKDKKLYGHASRTRTHLRCTVISATFCTFRASHQHKNYIEHPTLSKVRQAILRFFSIGPCSKQKCVTESCYKTEMKYCPLYQLLR